MWYLLSNACLTRTYPLTMYGTYTAIVSEDGESRHIFFDPPIPPSMLILRALLGIAIVLVSGVVTLLSDPDSP